MAHAPLRVAVIGCGVVGQVMHLPNLDALPDLFTIVALCDASPTVLDACARRYGASITTTRWRDLLDHDLDAVLVLTPGSHAPIVSAFVRAGVAVFVEKPIAFSEAEGDEILADIASFGTPVMVGYMKRYDPAYERLREVLPTIGAIRLVQTMTMETAFRPYLEHQPVLGADDLPPELLAGFAADDAQRVRAALDGDDEPAGSVYRKLLIDGLVHEFNLLRATLGEVTAVPHADLTMDRISIALRFADIPCSIDWVDMPGLARYQQRFAFVGENGSATLTFPSPYLANMPTRLDVEGGRRDSPHSWATTETVSFDEPFKLELQRFHALVTDGAQVPTTVADAVADIRLCQQVVAVHQRLVKQINEGEKSWLSSQTPR
jgi:predicted dehydrogenase